MFGPLIWSLLNAAATILTPLVLFVVFAQTGAAWQVGTVGVAVSLLEILKTLCPQGLYEILLRRETTKDEERASLGLLLLCGSIATLSYIGLILLVERLMTSAATPTPALLLLAPKLLFDVAALQPQAALARQLRFRRLAMRTVIANLLVAATGLAAMALGQPLEGLILCYVLQSALNFLLVFGQGALVRPSLSLAPLKSLIRQAGYSSGVRIVGAVNNYADTIVVSAFVSPALVGTYNLSKRIETLLMSIASSFSSIMYQPLFAHRSSSEGDHIVRNAVRLTTLIFGVPVVEFVLFRNEVIDWVFGSRWLAAAPVCAILALSGLGRIYGVIHGSQLSVTNRNGVFLVYASSSTIIGLGSVAALADYGLVWVAIAIALKSWLFSLTCALVAQRSAKTVVRLYLRHAFCPLFWFAACGLSARAIVAHWWPGGAAHLPSPILAIGLSAGLAGASILVIYWDEIVKFVTIARIKLGHKRPVPEPV